MIRINLIGTKVKAKPKGPGLEVWIYLGVLVLEVALLFVWYQTKASSLEEWTKRAKQATAKVKTLRQVKKEWERWQAEKADLERQAKVFDSLKADQLGPPLMLEFLSYALTRIPDVPANSDHLKAQELAGWNPKWDARRLWLTKLDEKEHLVTFKGQAVDHEDVAEFYRRLEASEFFYDIQPGRQEKMHDDDLGLEYVEFTATARVYYGAAKEILSAQKEQATPSFGLF